MQRYRTVWLRITRWLTAVGVCAAIAVLPMRGVLIAFVLSGMLGSLSAFTWGGRRGARPLLRIGFATGSVVLAAGGSVGLLGPAGVLPVAVLVLSAPLLLTRLYRLLVQDWDGVGSPQRTTAGYQQGSELAAIVQWATEQTLVQESWVTDPPASMDPAALCWAWRRSYLTLHKPLSIASRTLIVKRRQELLDEMEHRNPVGFAAWLDSGARAAGDPQRYILSRRDEPRH